MESNGRKSGKTGLYLFVLGLTALVHLPALGIPWQFDDYHHILNNPAVYSLENIPKFFVDPKLFTGRAGEGMYRPLLMTSHALTYFFSGYSPVGPHLVNLAFHLLNTALVLLLLLRWTGNRKVAASAALFWALAAVQHETVGYASARSSLMATAFMLSAVIATEGEQKSWKTGALAALFYCLALFSKEIAFILPLLIVLRDITIKGLRLKNMKSGLPVYLPLFALMPLYLLLRMALFDHAIGWNYVPRHLYMLTEAKVFFYYLEKILYPVNLTLFPDFMVVSGVNAAVIAASLGVALVLIAGLIGLRFAPTVALGVFWFVICLLPTSTLTPLFLVASIERVYPALLGPVAMAALWASRGFANESKGRRKIAVAAFALVLASQSAATAQRDFVWWDGITLMRDMVRGAPGFSTPWTWLGIMYENQKDYDNAKKYMLKALLINPDDSVAHESLGRIYIATGATNQARRQYEESLKRKLIPRDQRVSMLMKLAYLDMQDGNYEAAYKRLKDALQYKEDNADALILLGSLEERRGNLDKAAEYYRKALDYYPNYDEALRQLGVLEINRGNYEEGTRLLKPLAEKRVEWPEVYTSLAQAAMKLGHVTEAEQWAKKAVEVDPESHLGYLIQGFIAASLGEYDRAVQLFGAAVEKAPDSAQARSLYAKSLMDLARQYGKDTPQWTENLKKAADQIMWLLAHGAGTELKKEWETTTGQQL